MQWAEASCDKIESRVVRIQNGQKIVKKSATSVKHVCIYILHHHLYLIFHSISCNWRGVLRIVRVVMLHHRLGKFHNFLLQVLKQDNFTAKSS